MMLRVSRHVKGNSPIFLSTDSTVVHSSGIGSIHAPSETASAKMTGRSCRDDGEGEFLREPVAFRTEVRASGSYRPLAILASAGSRVDALTRASQDTY